MAIGAKCPPEGATPAVCRCDPRGCEAALFDPTATSPAWAEVNAALPAGVLAERRPAASGPRGCSTAGVRQTGRPTCGSCGSCPPRSARVCIMAAPAAQGTDSRLGYSDNSGTTVGGHWMYSGHSMYSGYRALDTGSTSRPVQQPAARLGCSAASARRSCRPRPGGVPRRWGVGRAHAAGPKLAPHSHLLTSAALRERARTSCGRLRAPCSASARSSRGGGFAPLAPPIGGFTHLRRQGSRRKLRAGAVGSPLGSDVPWSPAAGCRCLHEMGL